MYRLALTLLVPVALLYTLRRMLRDGDWRYLRQRCGFGLPRLDQRPLWFHCASVGEVHAAAPLAERVHQRWPHLPLLVSTNTPTGATAAARRFPAGTRHVYLPLDLASAARRFLHRCRPRAALIVETELWPNLYRACAEAGVAPVIVNARLSRRSLRAPRWLRRAQGQALQQVRAVLARSGTDAREFAALGAAADRIEICGNLKFAAVPAPAPPPPLSGRYWLAASTHAPEERYCAEIQQRHPELPLLVIVPRHPERGGELARELARLGLPARRRSHGEQPAGAERVYLADTLGELDAFMSHAELVFMGGSLMPRGGQNVLEAARRGCPVVVGPHVHNFADEVRALSEAGGLLQVADQSELAQTVCELAHDPGRRAALSAALRAAMQREADVAERYLTRLQRLCDLPQVPA